MNAEKTAEKQQKRIIGRPFKKGRSGNPRGRPKGAKNFSTLFEVAAGEVAEALKLGKKPDAVQIEIVKRGIKEWLGGNFNFYRDIMDRLYGKAPERVGSEGLKELTETMKK